MVKPGNFGMALLLVGSEEFRKYFDDDRVKVVTDNREILHNVKPEMVMIKDLLGYEVIVGETREELIFVIPDKTNSRS